jgi:hypothetical protein
VWMVGTFKRALNRGTKNTRSWWVGGWVGWRITARGRRACGTVNTPRTWPEGSMIRGYRLNRDMMIAFSVHKSSTGREQPFHARRSEAVDKYSIRDTSRLNLTPTMSKALRHSVNSLRRPEWSKYLLQGGSAARVRVPRC